MRNLRGRLTLGVVIVLAAIITAAGVIVSRRVDRTERSAVDDRLERTAQLSRDTALEAIDDSVPGSDKRLDAALRATGTSLTIFVGDAAIPPSRGTKVVGTPPRRLGLGTYRADGRDYRVYNASLRGSDLGGSATLQLIGGLSGVERRQARLNRTLVAIGLVGLLIAGGGTWLVASGILRPLRRLRAVAAGIADEEDLERRVAADTGPAELRSLATSFNAMLARLGRSAADRERALAATRRFTADAGHELRTPLTSVQATLSALARHPDVPASRRSEMLGDALAEQRRLVGLLDGLQALARGDAEAFEHTDVDLADVVDAAASGARARHRATELALDVPDDPIRVRGWEPGLRLIVDNLLENAERHGKPGGRIAVSLRGAGVGGAVLRVDDDGPGIPRDRREDIFEPFTRIERDDGGPGSGLGLALVAQQVRQHAATIMVGDAPLGGARIEVRFPVVSAHPESR